MIPIEIINKILVHVSELNNDVIITQYHLITNKEFYTINFHSDLLWKIKASLRMKQIYPIYSFENNKAYLELYRIGTVHYEKHLRKNDKRENEK